MAVGGHESDGESGLRSRGGMLAALAMFAAAGAAVAILATRPSGGQAAPLPTTVPATCDAYGPSWVKSFNKSAVAGGNPTRMLSACCQKTSLRGVHHCLIRLTLAGTTVQGCALYDLGANGQPVSTKISVGRKVNCPLHKQK
jgi:hypothetical protein